MCRRLRVRGIIAEATLRIGEVARMTGVPSKTLRYYEEVGLIRPASRTPAGYRLYGGRELEQVEFVRRAKLMGLTLGQIRALVEAAGSGIPGEVLGRLEELLEQRLEETERELEDLRAFRESLLGYRRRVSEAGERELCRCAEQDAGSFCGCVTTATQGVASPGLVVVAENGRVARSPEEGHGRCGCCEPVAGEAIRR